MFHRDAFSSASFSETSWKFNEIFQVPQIYRVPGADAFPRRPRKKTVREVVKDLHVALPVPVLKKLDRIVEQDLPEPDWTIPIRYIEDVRRVVLAYRAQEELTARRRRRQRMLLLFI